MMFGSRRAVYVCVCRVHKPMTNYEYLFPSHKDDQPTHREFPPSLHLNYHVIEVLPVLRYLEGHEHGQLYGCECIQREREREQYGDHIFVVLQQNHYNITLMNFLVAEKG